MVETGGCFIHFCVGISMIWKFSVKLLKIGLFSHWLCFTYRSINWLLSYLPVYKFFSNLILVFRVPYLRTKKRKNLITTLLSKCLSVCLSRQDKTFIFFTDWPFMCRYVCILRLESIGNKHKAKNCRCFKKTDIYCMKCQKSGSKILFVYPNSLTTFPQSTLQTTRTAIIYRSNTYSVLPLATIQAIRLTNLATLRDPAL